MHILEFPRLFTLYKAVCFSWIVMCYKELRISIQPRRSDFCILNFELVFLCKCYPCNAGIGFSYNVLKKLGNTNKQVACMGFFNDANKAVIV